MPVGDDARLHGVGIERATLALRHERACCAPGRSRTPVGPHGLGFLRPV